MKGHIRKHRDSWAIIVELPRDPQTGKRRQKWVTLKGTRTDAEKKLAELLHQVNTGSFSRPGKKLTVENFLTQWLNDYAAINVRPLTKQSYEHWIRKQIIPAIGTLLLSRLQPSHLQTFYRKALETGRIDGKGGLSRSSVVHIHRILHDALSYAVQCGLLSCNVADTVKPPRARHKEMRTLDSVGVSRLLEASKDTIYYHIFHLAVFTGMRRSELLGLRWRDVDLDMATVSVVQTLHCLGKGKVIFQEPKSSKGKRQIALSPAAVIALREHRQQQELERLDCLLKGAPVVYDDLVFSNSDGSPLLPNSVTHAFIKTVRRLGLREVRFHDLRHTHASLMLKQGIHPKIVSERLGHATIGITLDTYSHVTPGLQEAAALRFEQCLQQQNV